MLNKEKIFDIHYYIASQVYKKSSIGDIDDILKKFKIKNTNESKEIIGSILKYDNFNSQIGNKQIVGFFHETFVEFIIIKKVIDVIVHDPLYINDIFPIDFRHFNVKFFESAIQTLTEDEEKKYRINLESLYYYLLTNSEKNVFMNYISTKILTLEDIYHRKVNLKMPSNKDKIKNSIVYCYGKIRGRTLRKNPKFLLYIYENELNVRVRICAALAAIKHKIFLSEIRANITYEEDFLDRIKNDKVWNCAIRSISLVFWQDEKKGDILLYIDDLGEWDQTKKRNLHRIYKTDDKSKRTRVLDLTLLYIFYESREWKDFDLKTFQSINKCKFIDYPNDVKLVYEIKELFMKKDYLVVV